MAEVWADIKTYRRAYLLTAVASFGGMLFGWDTGLIGGMHTHTPGFFTAIFVSTNSNQVS